MQIAILSRQASLYSTRRLTEAARRLGHRVRVLDPLELPVEIGYAQPRLVETLPRLDAIVPRIGASITELGCAVVRQFENNRVWTINPSVGIAGSRDKLLSLQMLSEGGIPVPRTAVVGHPSQLEKAIESVGGLPVVLKLRRGTQGKGVVLVHSLVAARRVHSFWRTFNNTPWFRNTFPEARNRDIRVIVLGETAIAAMERRAAPGEFRANLHRGATAHASAGRELPRKSRSNRPRFTNSAWLEST